MDIKPADLPLLISLNVLLEENNVTRAAARLHLSQSALSAQLARLRDMFGDALLVPSETGRGMVPTSKASSLKGPLRAALQQLNQAISEDGEFDPLTSTRCFTVAANDNAISMFGLDFIRHAEQSGFHGIKIAFCLPDPETIVARMERDEVDLLLATVRIIPSALKIRLLSTERYHMAQRKGHPRGQHPPSLDEYCQMKHVLVSTTGGFQSFIDTQLAESGRKRRVTVSVPHYDLVPSIIATTDYVCTLPVRFLKRFEDQIDIFPLPLALPEFSIAQAWHPRSEADGGNRWLRDQISRLARSGADYAKSGG
jgi:DNA-binding transcriptional LysR family regulator